MIDLHGISQASFDLIVACEVSSRAVYERRYRHSLECPGEQSGPTGGCGYDFGQNSRAQIAADWEGKVDADQLRILLGAAGLTHEKAQAYCSRYRGKIDIAWDVAMDVFSNHDIPRYLAICRRYLPGFDELHPHCKGVLLSVAFNRDASGFVKADSRYAEMHGIRDAVKAGQLARVPGLLRSMKRLWPNSKGLRDRRDAEAALWEAGLREGHPAAHDRLAHEPEPVDPAVVENVQRQLKALGYFQVGAVDGSATPGGKLEDAILAFRNRNGLPLSTAIDDDLIQALAHARPPEISDARAEATVKDLREQGSETISFTDKAKAWAGRIFGGSIAGGGGLTWLTERLTQAQDARSAIGGLGISANTWGVIAVVVLLALVGAACGLGMWYVAHRIEQKRLADYRTGKNP